MNLPMRAMAKWWRRLWAWWINANLCAQCEDSRGGWRAVGNGQWIEGRVLCDWCHADHMREQEARERLKRQVVTDIERRILDSQPRQWWEYR